MSKILLWTCFISLFIIMYTCICSIFIVHKYYSSFEGIQNNNNHLTIYCQIHKRKLSRHFTTGFYCVDGTGLDKSLTISSDTKGKKDRITVALCWNADGSEKIKPFGLRIQDASKTLMFNCTLIIKRKQEWMTSLIFSDFLWSFNAQMRQSKRKVLLIMDNAPSHLLPMMWNVKPHFLPPTTTSHLQPLDAGIILNFKSHYRKF